MRQLHGTLFLALILGLQSAVATTTVLFSPDDHPTARLVNMIDKAKKRVYAAVYMLTDSQIATALIAAQKRGVDVKLVLDHSSVDTAYGKGKLLQRSGITLFVFKTPSSRRGKKSCWGPLMHNKFALIDNQAWTGSFNWTKSANVRNQENVIITDSPEACRRFEQHFEVLKRRCVCLALPAQRGDTLPWWKRWVNKLLA
jgi:phosphatidylserine/phosphatidylglycerophosphate/cardiolipin synthase-like enzyme